MPGKQDSGSEEKEPKSAEYEYGQAKTYEKRDPKKYGASVLAHCDKAIQLDPAYAKAYYTRGNAYRTRWEKSKHPLESESAMVNYNLAIALSTKSAPKKEISKSEVYNAQKTLYEAMGQSDRTIKFYEKFLSLKESQTPENLFQAAVLYEKEANNRKREADEASASEKDALTHEANKNFGKAIYYYQRAFRESGMVGPLELRRESERKLATLLPLLQTRANILAVISTIQPVSHQVFTLKECQKENNPLGERMLKKGFKVSVGYSSNEIPGKIEAQLKKFEGRVEEKETVESCYQEAKSFFEQKNTEECIAYCNKALDLKPRYADAYYLRARAYHDNKDYVNACIDYRTFLELSALKKPANKKAEEDLQHYRYDAKFSLGQLYSFREGCLEKATEIFDELKKEYGKRALDDKDIYLFSGHVYKELLKLNVAEKKENEAKKNLAKAVAAYCDLLIRCDFLKEKEGALTPDEQQLLTKEKAGKDALKDLIATKGKKEILSIVDQKYQPKVNEIAQSASQKSYNKSRQFQPPSEAGVELRTVNAATPTSGTPPGRRHSSS